LCFQHLAGPAIDEQHLKVDLIFDKMEISPELMDIPTSNNVNSAPSEVINDEHDVSSNGGLWLGIKHSYEACHL
jgi:hypothetical protein